MSDEIKKISKEILPTPEERLEWFAEYERVGKVPPVCKKFGISRKTFYKWWRRYKRQNQSLDSLKNRSRRPHSNPRATPEHIVKRLKMLREQTGFGQKRLQLYLAIWYGIDIAENTIWKILRRSGVDMKGTKSKRRKIKLNEPLFPGDRIVLFVKQFEKEIRGHKYYYYAAADECTHLRVGKIYGRHSTLSALDFIQHVITSLPFPIHYVHTPLDNVFTSVAQSRSKTHAFTQNVRRLGIKHHVPTRKQFESDLYFERMKKFDSADGFLKLSFNSVVDAERTIHNYLLDYNNKQPRIEIQKLTPLQKLQQFEQFKELTEFDPLRQS
ncbi:MAG: helix-turn-helix domain-containing protein [Ignavibacteriales bacterium]|nr:helix-turn-helix domain-containing protein [Ignavibacteriales bacterium]